MMLKQQFSSFLIASMCFLSVSAIKGEEKVFKISTGGIKDKNDKTHVLLGPPMGEVGFPHPRRISPQLSPTEKWLPGDNPEFNAGGKLIDYGPVTFGRICNGVTTHKEFVEHTFSVYRTDEIDTKLSAVGTQITNLGTSITNASAEAKKINTALKEQIEMTQKDFGNRVDAINASLQKLPERLVRQEIEMEIERRVKIQVDKETAALRQELKEIRKLLEQKPK